MNGVAAQALAASWFPLFVRKVKASLGNKNQRKDPALSVKSTDWSPT